MSRDRATPSPELPKVPEQVETSTEKRVSAVVGTRRFLGGWGSALGIVTLH